MIRFYKNALFVFLIISLQSCEIDDICVQEVVTPKLIIKFYDAADREIEKQVDTLSVWAEGKDKLYEKVKTDSIAIPLNSAVDVVNYFFESSSLTDTLQIHYTRKEIFVSRSCGFKMNFILGNETQLSCQWTDSFETEQTPQSIENEQEVHLKIYH